MMMKFNAIALGVLALPRRALILLVHGYRLLLRPMLQANCRYEPSCSAYAVQALTLHGAGAGSFLAARRVLRCHPFCAGGVDPVPPNAPALFTRFTDDIATASPDADPLPPSPSIPRSAS